MPKLFCKIISDKKDMSSNICLKYASWITSIRPALHYKYDVYDLEHKIVKHTVCTQGYQVKSPFREIIQGWLGQVDPKRKIFTFQEISDLMIIYIHDRKNHFFRDKNDKACWIKGDPLETCFGVETFQWNQLRPLMMAQLIPLRRSPRLTA